MSPGAQRTSPEDTRRIVAHARQHMECQDCSAAPGEPCDRPGSGRSIHKSRYIAAAIEVKRQARAARQTPEQAAERAAILARLPKIPASEFAAITTERGGLRATREWLISHGIPYPPPAGWRQAVEQEDGNTTERTTTS
jgi:hypothetical protein